MERLKDTMLLSAKYRGHSQQRSGVPPAMSSEISPGLGDYIGRWGWKPVVSTRVATESLFLPSHTFPPQRCCSGKGHLPHSKATDGALEDPKHPKSALERVFAGLWTLRCGGDVRKSRTRKAQELNESLTPASHQLDLGAVLGLVGVASE